MFSGGFQGIASEEQVVGLTLYTDTHIIRGSIHTRQRRITDILNDAEHDFLVLTDVVMDDLGSRAVAARAEYVQVNLASVLFAVADNTVEAIPELRTAKVPEQAMISIPPFRIVGHIHLLPERNLRDALAELVGGFVPATDAYYWSDSMGEARANAAIVAFNHARAQIMAPHREVDPWEGLDRSAGAGERAPDAVGSVPTDVASTSTVPGSQDPWGASPPPDTERSGVQDPWGFERQAPGGQEPATPSAADAPDAPSNPWGGPGGDPWGTGRKPRDDESSG
jgi:hypothetical protein